MLAFDGFRFDRRNSRLEGPEGVVPLNPKAFDVLAVLVERAGNLVTKDALLDAVWGEAHVSDGVLKVSVAELRKALGDSAATPRFIETVHRRGYRFIAAVREAAAVAVAVAAVPAPAVDDRVGLVGRAGELARLAERLALALGGDRQVVFVTGEPGAGKTAVVAAFLADAERRHGVAIAESACLERFGATEAYMPVLEAIGRLARKHARVRELLRRYAPTWLAQLPWLAEQDGGGGGVAPERMLREMVELLDVLTEETPLVLVLEDLHWSDPSTVDLLALLAERRERARLMVLTTYRPAELVIARHPLRPVSLRLLTSRRATEITLEELGSDAVGEYVARRFPGQQFPRDLPGLVRARTDGNALFLVALVDQLVADGVIAERDGGWTVTRDVHAELAAVPESLRRLIGEQLERLATDDRRLVEAASLVGTEFPVTLAAAAAEREATDAEARCARLAASGSLLRSAGVATWPGGALSEQYAFRHALYRETLAANVPPTRRSATHARIGAALEAAYEARAPEIAAVLAVHFAEGGDRLRAVGYRRAAAATAMSRHALVEAEAHLDAALALLGGMPASAERDREELLVQSTVGAVRMATRGYSAPQVEAAYSRVLALSGDSSDGPDRVPILWGLWSFQLVRADLDLALALAERIAAAAAPSAEPLLLMVGHWALWSTHLVRGDFAECERHLDAGEALYERIPDPRVALAFGQDPKMAALANRSILAWHVGRIDTALALVDAAVAHARGLGHPMSIAFAMAFKGWLHILRREPEECLREAEAATAYATEQGLPHWIPGTLHSRGWARVELGDIAAGTADMEEGLRVMESLGAGLGWGPRATDLAVAYARAGRTDDARALLARARVALDETAERYSEPELLYAEAELDPAAAYELLTRSIEVAARQGARTMELRAWTALVGLGLKGAAGKAARAALADLYATFDEGHGTRDLRDAKLALAGARGRR
jgi:DNA-binding winged helix-turn-helix (wHTH) protein/tetratricopeptide (TPR) repeat protein